MKPFIALSIVCAFVALAGCSSSSSSGSGGNGASIAPPAVGFQLTSTSVTLAAGAEQYLCWSYELPSAFSVVGTVTGMPNDGVHHYAVFTSSAVLPASPYGYDCHLMDGSWGLVSGGGRSTPGFDFPNGVGMPLPAKQHIVFQLHLLNAASTSLTVPVAAVNLVGSTSTNLQVAGVVIAGNLDISIPPHATTDITGGCAAANPMANIFAVFPHMHTLGTHISMSVTPTGTTTPDMIVDQSWDFGSQGVYPATGAAAQGDQLTVTCTFDNPTADTVHFGESTTDEMCLGVFYYYPATIASQYCGFSNN
jgi:hypothetical protein